MSLPCFSWLENVANACPRLIRPSMIWQLCLSPHPPQPHCPCSWLHCASFPQTLQAHLHLRAFALAVPSAYSALPPNFQWLVPSCHSYPVSSSQRGFPNDTIQRGLPPGHSPSPLCFTFFLALITSEYFLVHLLRCGGGFGIVVCHPHIYHIKGGTQLKPCT